MNNSETIYRSCIASLIEMLKVENEVKKEELSNESTNQ